MTYLRKTSARCSRTCQLNAYIYIERRSVPEVAAARRGVMTALLHPLHHTTGSILQANPWLAPGFCTPQVAYGHISTCQHTYSSGGLICRMKQNT